VKLFVMIGEEKFFLDEEEIKKYNLHPGMITPFSGLEIQEEDEVQPSEMDELV